MFCVHCKVITCVFCCKYSLWIFTRRCCLYHLWSLLFKILCLSEILKLLWSSESQCTLNSLNQLELKYMKAVWNFTELLQRSIPSSSHQVYNSIFDLWSSMLISSPAHNVPED
uniref:Uncharacterized protein n=1 Tax=Cacopsylla melanoneura TaxID=428564 RepID=A0A8D8YNX2_9HEMI